MSNHSPSSSYRGGGLLFVAFLATSPSSARVNNGNLLQNENNKASYSLLIILTLWKLQWNTL